MKRIFFYIALSTLYSCNKPLDLSLLTLGTDAQQYNLENNKNLESNVLKGHYEWQNINGKITLITIDKGETATNYHEINDLKNQFNYQGVQTDSTCDAKIVVYQNKIVEVSATFSDENSFKLIEKLLKDFGEPTKIFNDKTDFGENRDQNIYFNFKKYFPKNTILEKDSVYADKQLTHPRDILWDKRNSITIVGIYLDNDDKIRLVLGTMSKKAYFDRVLYPPATEKNLFYEYLKSYL